jgi:regulator of RNase E activity RraB
MSPSVLQLQATGVQDSYLTKDPEINIFKYNYYRYVNFATETIKLNMNGIASFGQKTSCDILKKGHLLSKLHLHIKLPKLTKANGDYLCWSDTIGYGIFSEPIELQVGGVIIDRLYPQFLNARDELTNSSKQLGKNFMLLKSDTYTSNYSNAEKDVDLIIPLDFWFTKNYQCALPLLSMASQDIKINFKFKNFSECINYDGSDPDAVYIIDSSVLAEYIYLDDIIINQFKNQQHKFVIDQQIYNGDEIIPENTTVYNSALKFNLPCKELLFLCVEKNNINTNNIFCYSKTSDNSSLVSNVSLLLDGRLRFDNLPEFYYRSIFPEIVHSVIPMKYIYIMPFCTRPEDNQPTGSLNMSNFNDITLFLKMQPNNPELRLYVFALCYNIVIIENGLLRLEY